MGIECVFFISVNIIQPQKRLYQYILKSVDTSSHPYGKIERQQTPLHIHMERQKADLVLSKHNRVQDETSHNLYSKANEKQLNVSYLFQKQRVI